MKTASVALVSIVALVGLLFLSSATLNPMIITDKVIAAYNPQDYRLPNDCYIGFKTNEKLVPGKGVKIQNTHAGEQVQRLRDDGWRECGLVNEENPRQTALHFCDSFAKCSPTSDNFGRAGFNCIQRKVEKIEYCD